MSASFGVVLSDVRIHEGGHAESMGAVAYAQGTDIHFAPGQYDPGSQRGQELLGHELAHVVQQRAGRVAPTIQASGLDVNVDEGLEREADAWGAAAAHGERISAPSLGAPIASPVVQGKFKVGGTGLDRQGRGRAAPP